MLQFRILHWRHLMIKCLHPGSLGSTILEIFDFAIIQQILVSQEYQKIRMIIMNCLVEPFLLDFLFPWNFWAFQKFPEHTVCFSIYSYFFRNVHVNCVMFLKKKNTRRWSDNLSCLNNVAPIVLYKKPSRAIFFTIFISQR